MQKYIIGGVAVIIAAAMGFYFFTTYKAKPAQVNTPVIQDPIPNTYATSTFSIKYPNGYTVDESYAYQGVPKKPIAGVKFEIPGTMATGTNLSSDSGISVESLPRAKLCTADIYFFENVRAHDFKLGSTTYSVATSSGAGAGNFYEEQMYAIPGSHPCIAVRYMIHSSNIGNYEPGAVREFDRTSLLADFDKIRDSLQIK